MIWGLLALIFVVALFGGCAIAIGDRSTATVVNRTETKREVNEDTATIEDVLLEKAKEKKQ